MILNLKNGFLFYIVDKHFEREYPYIENTVETSN